VVASPDARVLDLAGLQDSNDLDLTLITTIIITIDFTIQIKSMFFLVIFFLKI
jgi:hypothetical protein